MIIFVNFLFHFQILDVFLTSNTFICANEIKKNKKQQVLMQIRRTKKKNIKGFCSVAHTSKLFAEHVSVYLSFWQCTSHAHPIVDAERMLYKSVPAERLYVFSQVNACICVEWWGSLKICNMNWLEVMAQSISAKQANTNTHNCIHRDCMLLVEKGHTYFMLHFLLMLSTECQMFLLQI